MSVCLKKMKDFSYRLTANPIAADILELRIIFLASSVVSLHVID